MLTSLSILVFAVAGFLVLAISFWARYKTVGADDAMIVTGSMLGSKNVMADDSGRKRSWLTMIIAYKIRLNPNNKQHTQLEQSAHVARWAYNWALNQKKSHYEETKKSYSQGDLRKQ